MQLRNCKCKAKKHRTPFNSEAKGTINDDDGVGRLRKMGVLISINVIDGRRMCSVHEA